MMADILKPSTQDMIALGAAVQERFSGVLDLHFQMKGTPVPISPSLDSDIKLWAAMHARHLMGDFRNTDGEKQATRNVAQWTLDLNASLRGQSPKTLQWKD
jgi:hypothetical protein